MLVNGEKIHINENDKELKILFNINEVKPTGKKLCSDKEAEQGAERYIKLLNAPTCREFFLKVMYHLPYDTRERILESALKPWVKAPAHYYTYCAKKELALLGF